MPLAIYNSTISAVSKQQTTISTKPSIAIDITKKIIDLNNPIGLLKLLATLDHKLTDKYLDCYYGNAVTKEQFIEKHEHLIATLSHFLENANAINPYATCSLFLSDKESKLLIKIDSERANGKVNKLISFELKTFNDQLKQRFEELQNTETFWKKEVLSEVTQTLETLITNHLEHIPGVKLVKEANSTDCILQEIN